MDKEELMKMASEAGLFSRYSTDAQRVMYDFHYEDYLRFANVILERAAQVAESEPKVWDLDAPSPQQRIASKIRSLKTE